MIVIFVFLRKKVILEIVKATTYFRMIEWWVNYVLEAMWEEIVVAEYEDLPGTLRKQRNIPTEYPVFGLRFEAGNYELDLLPTLSSRST